jgi:signal peptidase II
MMWMVVAIVVVVADQVTKWAIVEWVPLYDKVPLNSFINLTHQKNSGAAFSFLADAGGWQRWFFTITTIVISAIILFWIKRMPNEEKITIVSLCLILGGAIGNLIDRLYLGYVIDFIQVWLGSYAWPAFNIADASISVGATVLILSSFINSEKPAAKES